MSRYSKSLLNPAAALWLTVALLLGAAVTADEIRFRGKALQGKVTNMTAAGVEFEIPFGTLTFPFEDVESLTTDKPLYVIHGDHGESFGRLLGVEDGHLLVGDDPATADRIDVTTIIETDTEEELEGLLGAMEHLRNRYRYWTGSVHAGFSYTDKTTDEIDINVGVNIERRKKPTRFLLKVDHVFGRDKSKGQDATKSDNEILGYTKGEYDLTEKIFLFSSASGEYDEIDRLSYRLIGGGGPGYRFFETEKYRLQAEVAGSYVTKRFFGGDTEEYPAAYFAAEAAMTLPLGSALEGRVSYLPSFEDWPDEYLISADASLTVPLSTYLSFKATIRNTYDSTPDNNAERNEFKTLLALAWRF